MYLPIKLLILQNVPIKGKKLDGSKTHTTHEVILKRVIKYHAPGPVRYFSSQQQQGGMRDTKMTAALLYANRTEEDILVRKDLE